MIRHSCVLILLHRSTSPPEIITRLFVGRGQRKGQSKTNTRLSARTGFLLSVFCESRSDIARSFCLSSCEAFVYTRGKVYRRREMGMKFMMMLNYWPYSKVYFVPYYYLNEMCVQFQVRTIAY